MNEDRGFLREILANPDDSVARLVYADWLDERGDTRGEFLRGELQLRQLDPNDARHGTLKTRLAELHAEIDPGWLALLDWTDIENCGVRFEFECPQRWEALQQTEDNRVRFCEKCRMKVYHCTTLKEGNRHARRRDCVAVDSRLARTPGDLVVNPGMRMLRMGRTTAPRLPVSEQAAVHQPPRNNRRRRGRR